MNKLTKYLEKQGITMTYFAYQLDISWGNLQSIMLEKSLPNLLTAMKIEILTDGKVTCQDLAKPFLKKESKKKQDRRAEYNKNITKLRKFHKAPKDFVKD